jgi:DNA-binding MarR family transcriptional regulator
MSTNTLGAPKTTAKTSLEDAYLVFIKFLMLSKQRIVELGSEYDLTAMQTLMLFMIDQPRPMNSFKKMFNCDASNITGLVDGLEQKELASRYESQEDRRIKMVKLEQRGRAVRSALLRRMGDQDSPLLSQLKSSEFQTFIGLLQKVTNAG